MHPLNGGMIDLYGNFSDQHEVMRWGDGRDYAKVKVSEKEGTFYMTWDIHISRCGGHAHQVTTKCPGFSTVDEAILQARKEVEKYLKDNPSESIEASLLSSMQMHLF